MSPKTGTQKSAKSASVTGRAVKGFTHEERAAMKERVQELKAEARRGPRGKQADGESDVLAKIAEMPKPDRAMAERLHAIIKASAPALSPRTWYGMPAYAKDGNVVCFFQSAHKFKTRYATFGFSDKANLDEGTVWPVAFAEFRGYENWQVVSISQDGGLLAAILANPVMIAAYRAGVPGNGKSFPDGARMAKVHWNPKKLETFPAATVPGTLHDVDFMVKDSKRFADSGGWGWAVFEYEAASGRFTPGTTADAPPQGNDAKCGFACHTIVKTRDYVFTDYGSR